MRFYLHIKTADINLHLSSIAIIRNSLTFAAVLRFLKIILSTCSENFYNEKVGQNYYFRGSLNNAFTLLTPDLDDLLPGLVFGVYLLH